MTIAVAARYPWGELNRLIPPGYAVPEAIILAADSRFSRKTGNSYLSPLDVGAKLFQLGRDVAAVYAGATEVAEQCISELRSRLFRPERIICGHSREVAEKTFQNVYNSYIASKKVKPEELPLYILIGACDTRARAELYQFSYARNFKAEPIAGLCTLGWPETIAIFERLLEGELHNKIEEQISLRQRCPPQIPMAAMLPMPIRPEEVAIIIAAQIQSTIKSRIDATIGGLIQCAVVTTEGFKLQELAYSTNPTNEGGWTTATANPDELRTVSGKLGFNKLNGKILESKLLSAIRIP